MFYGIGRYAIWFPDTTSTAEDDQLLIEQEILRDHRSDAAGPQSFAVMTARCNRVSRTFLMRASA